LKKEFTPEDLAHIRATYQNYGINLRWMLRSVLIGAAVGIVLAAVVGGIALSNPALWLGLAYGAALPVLNYTGPAATVCEFILAPVTFAKELGRRAKEIADGRRSLKERFADYY
jgi:hypothetical protein